MQGLYPFSCARAPELKQHSIKAIQRNTQCQAGRSVFRRALFGCIPLVEHMQAKSSSLNLFTSLREAVQIWSGGEAQPMPVTILKDPGSIYVQYPLTAQQQAIIEQQLPPGLELAKIKTTLSAQSQMQLTLNAYHIQGSVVKGCRMELSTYVQQTDKKNQAGSSAQPFYLILQAWCDQPSYDPTKGMTLADNLTMATSENGLEITLIQDNQPDLILHFATMDVLATSSKEWAEANGRCYWANGDFDSIEDITPFEEQPYQQMQLTKAKGRLELIEAINAPISVVKTTTDLHIQIRPQL